MKSLRRYDIRPAVYFLTLVTFERGPYLLRDPSIFLASWQPRLPVAWVILPDHFHVLVNCRTDAISSVVYQFKMAYWYAYRRQFGKGRVWQHRFWDHIIRDSADFRHHLDYIHANPVRHCLAKEPGQYAHSSFQIWKSQGYYDDEWEMNEVTDNGLEHGE